jgi:hypothetical protein
MNNWIKDDDYSFSRLIDNNQKRKLLIYTLEHKEFHVNIYDGFKAVYHPYTITTKCYGDIHKVQISKIPNVETDISFDSMLDKINSIIN